MAESIVHAQNFRDLTGQVFGRLTVIAFVYFRAGNSHWLCRCECGTEKTVGRANLISGRQRSCGCLNQEARSARRKHGLRHSPEYVVWAAMKQRCSDPNFKDYHRYGGRGISVCERWRESFAAFYADMGPRPSPKHQIDRFPDQNGNYEPANCRWATPTENTRNCRSNRLLTFNGETMPLAAWAERTGIDADALSARLCRYGWSVERALTTPMRPSRYRKRESHGGD